jgi:hypothetical protein
MTLNTNSFNHDSLKNENSLKDESIKSIISPSLQEKLNLETALIPWKDLELFFAKGHLLIVDHECDLIHVASQIGSHQIDAIESLIYKNLIQFATPRWIKKNCSETTLFWAVVIAPYVFVQLKQ